ncbi:MAG: hypothetical protein ACO3A2_09840, partial [Bdellovibrionia bacterium]
LGVSLQMSADPGEEITENEIDLPQAGSSFQESSDTGANPPAARSDGTTFIRRTPQGELRSVGGDSQPNSQASLPQEASVTPKNRLNFWGILFLGVFAWVVFWVLKKAK